MFASLAGCNESERIGGPEIVRPGGRALCRQVKAARLAADWLRRRVAPAG